MILDACGSERRVRVVSDGCLMGIWWLKGGWTGGYWGWPNGERKKREMEP